MKQNRNKKIDKLRKVYADLKKGNTQVEVIMYKKKEDNYATWHKTIGSHLEIRENKKTNLPYLRAYTINGVRNYNVCETKPINNYKAFKKEIKGIL